MYPEFACTHAHLQPKLDVPYDSQEHLEAGKMVVQLLQDLAMPPELKKLDWDTAPLAPSLLVRVRSCALFGHSLA